MRLSSRQCYIFRSAVLLTAAAACIQGRTSAAWGAGQGGELVVMTCEPQGPDSVLLKMVVFNAGRAFARDGAARVEFATGPWAGKTFVAPLPGPRTATVALRTKGWQPDHVEVARFGPFVLDGRAPKEIHVRGGLVGDPATRLGTLVRNGKRGAAVTFRRHFPLPEPAPGELRVLTAASAERLPGGRFLLKVAYFNCGQQFAKDLSAFVHFEFEAKGENLEEPCALKLYPRSRAMDTAAWRQDEVTVVQFGPFEMPSRAPGRVYVRAGIYDQFGTQARLPIAGSDDGTGRVLVGRFVRGDGRVWFERQRFPTE